MTRASFIGIAAALVMLCPVAAWAQYPSDVVGFNGPPIDDESAHEMFQPPGFSGTTSRYLVDDADGAFRASGFQTEGDAALEVYFTWEDTTDPNAWCRLSTYNGAERPNPSLDTRGKIRFNLTNVGSFGSGQIAFCLGIRETGVDVAQLDDGSTHGPIEWIGVDTTVNAITAGADLVVDTTAAGDDVQEYAVGTDVSDLPLGTAVISPGTNGVIDTTPTGDDEERFGYFLGGPTGTARIPIPAVVLPEFYPFSYEFEYDLTTGEVWVDGESWGGGIAGFTGNGTLADAPLNRGTLEQIALTNVVSDDAAFVRVVIDELQFEATVPDPTPPPVISGPVFATDSTVEVVCIPEATEAELFKNDVSVGTVVPVGELATFNVSLNVGDMLTATQTANGIVSELSTPVIVFAEGTALADSFDLYDTQEELEAIWTPTEPENDRRVRLSSGSACSCQNFLVSDYLPGPSVSKLYFSLGSVNGTDAEPLKLTYHFKHDVNETEARTRIELTSSLTRAYGALGFAFTNGPGGLWGEQYTTMTNSPEPIIDGYASDYFYYDYALTGIQREPGVWHKMQIVVKSDVVNFYIDDVLANPVDEITGDPIWPAGVPRVNNDNFRYLIVGVGYSNNGITAMYDDISVTVGNTPIPFGPCVPLDAPTVNGPLFPAATQVDVSDVDPAATQVDVYADGIHVGTASGSFPAGTATVTVDELAGDALVTATQAIGGTESCFSWPVSVNVPTPTLPKILLPGATTVIVSDIEEGLATHVTVYRDTEGDLTVLGTFANPTVDPVTVTVPELEDGWNIVATQTIGDVEGPTSESVLVAFPSFVKPWIETEPIPRGRTDHQLVYCNGYVYCIGGRDDGSQSAINTVFYAKVNDDGSVGPWQETTALTEATAAHGAAEYNGRIYTWGGWTTGYPTINTCYYADPDPNDGSIDAWTLSTVTIPNNLDVDPVGTQMDSFGRGTMIHNGVLYIINGEWDNGDDYGLTNSCYYSTITSGGDYGPWQPTTPTATEGGSWFHGVAAIEGTTEDYMYRVAGNYGGSTESDMYMSVIQPDGSLGTWVEDPQSLPAGRYEHACTVVRNRWIFANNGLSGDAPQTTVYYTEVDPDTGAMGEWFSGPDYPLAVSRNAAVSYEVNGRHYILVVSGGPYQDPPRNPACHYTLVGFYHDMADMAEFQACFDPIGSTQDCVDAFDSSGNGVVDFDDLPEFNDWFVGPDF